MEKAYLWFAVKVNLLLFLVTLVVGMLSGLFLWPLNLVFALTSSDLIRLIITAVWIGVVTIIPNYFAFKFVYKGQSLRLVEAVVYTVILKVMLDLIYINFSEESVEALPTILSLSINAGISFVVFYFAGGKYQPNPVSRTENVNDNENPSTSLNPRV